jgi:secondary thiamine-phosphate synthase enzyme
VCEPIEIIACDRIELVDITYEVETEIANSEIMDGVGIITVDDQSAGIIINENEQGMILDITNLLNKLVSYRDDYQFNETNKHMDPQLKALLLGSGGIVRVVNGRLKLGRWQSIFFVELLEPTFRSSARKANLTVIGN